MSDETPNRMLEIQDRNDESHLVTDVVDWQVTTTNVLVIEKADESTVVFGPGFWTHFREVIQ